MTFFQGWSRIAFDRRQAGGERSRSGSRFLSCGKKDLKINIDYASIKTIRRYADYRKSGKYRRYNMGFINELVTYAILVVGIGALALGGIFFGKFLRDKHDSKKKV